MEKVLTMIASAVLCVGWTACSANRSAWNGNLVRLGDGAHPLYVGTSTNGDTVLAATHYDAANGLAVTAQDLGLKGDAPMTCTRETLTGSHVSLWTCRYNKEAAAQRAATQSALSRAAPNRSRDQGPTCTQRSN